MKNPKLILITGESGSGKTTIAKTLTRTLADKEVFLIEMDKYFIPYNKRENERKQYDDNSPSAFYIEELVNDIKNAIDSKAFDYIIVEGTLTLYCDSIKDLSEYKIFVDCDEEVRFSRRMENNMEFGMGFDDLTNVYLDIANQRHNQYVQMSGNDPRYPKKP